MPNRRDFAKLVQEGGAGMIAPHWLWPAFEDGMGMKRAEQKMLGGKAVVRREQLFINAI